MKLVEEMTDEQLINLLFAGIIQIYDSPIGRVCNLEGIKFDVLKEIDKRMTNR